jgi:CelD/BcsL family acetyltransferase involved in cellulose biosynthesis
MPHVPARLSAEVITTNAAFARLEHEWDGLLDESDQQVYFMRWGWTHLWWTHLAPAGGELRIVACRSEDGALVGVAPFYLRRLRSLWMVDVRELLFLGTGVTLKTSEFLNIAARRGHEQAVARLVASVLKQRADWDRIWCCRVPGEAPVLQEFMSALAEKSTSRPYENAPYIDTSAGWAHYKSSLGRSMRRNVDYYSRRLFKKYSCEFARVESADALDHALDALVRLHVTRWEAQGEVGSLADPVFETFLRQAVHHSLAVGKLRLWTLKIDASIEAVLVGFLDSGILHYFQKGHNPDFSKDDLGTAMVALCVRDCCDDDAVQAFDFMSGGAAYKTMWARHSRETALSEVSRSNIRTLAFDVEQVLKSAATAVFRTIAPMRLRAARRDWLKTRELKDHLRKAAHLLIGLAAAVPASLERCLTWVEAWPVVADVAVLQTLLHALLIASW